MRAARAPLAALAALATAALIAVPAQSSIESRQQLEDQPRAWSSVAGMDTSAVMASAGSFATGEVAGADAPYCDVDNAVAQTLTHDFGESLVDDTKVGSANTQLWASPLMGTWTLVMARPDKTSCIVASGIGYSDDTNPDVFYAQAGIIG